MKKNLESEFRRRNADRNANNNNDLGRALTGNWKEHICPLHFFFFREFISGRGLQCSSWELFKKQGFRLVMPSDNTKPSLLSESWNRYFLKKIACLWLLIQKKKSGPYPTGGTKAVLKLLKLSYRHLGGGERERQRKRGRERKKKREGP